jgi:hypothetical protein
MTPVRQDETGVDDTGKECITIVVDTIELHSNTGSF